MNNFKTKVPQIACTLLVLLGSQTSLHAKKDTNAPIADPITLELGKPKSSAPSALNPKQPVLLEDTPRHETIFGYNQGPQPVISQPQVMIVGDAGGMNPKSPNTWRGPRTDFVVIENWQWNEGAIRKGADIQMPDQPNNASIEKLTNSDLNQTSNMVTEDNANLTQNTPQTKNIDPLETPSKKPETSFIQFLELEGKKHNSLRKQFRTLNLAYRSQTDQAEACKGPKENVGFHPTLGWVAFQTKNWRDLSNVEISQWLKNPKYLEFKQNFQPEQSKTLLVQMEKETKNDTQMEIGEIPTKTTDTSLVYDSSVTKVMIPTKTTQKNKLTPKVLAPTGPEEIQVNLNP
jgi:hypothetical protein